MCVGFVRRHRSTSATPSRQRDVPNLVRRRVAVAAVASTRLPVPARRVPTDRSLAVASETTCRRLRHADQNVASSVAVVDPYLHRNQSTRFRWPTRLPALPVSTDIGAAE